MKTESNQPCKCPFTCERHGGCSACKDFHQKDNSKTYCEKSPNEKKIDNDQADIGLANLYLCIIVKFKTSKSINFFAIICKSPLLGFDSRIRSNSAN